MAFLRHATRARLRPPQLIGAAFRRTLASVPTVDNHYMDVDPHSFKDVTDRFQGPAVLRPPRGLPVQNIAAHEKWFNHGPDEEPFTPYLRDFSDHIFTYELMSPQPTDGGDAVSLFSTWLSKQATAQNQLSQITSLKDALRPPRTPPAFHQLHAPLALLISALRFNATSPHPLRNLYIAQFPHSDLPRPLTEDLPTPRIVKEAGKGDVYGTSIWMGLEPTDTPFHRDPNPNLFVQLRGSKVVRMLPPKNGDALYRDLLRELGKGGSTRFRGSEMMDGPERQLLAERVWDHHGDFYQVTVRPGEALYVPLGWWHSVRSEGQDGDLNASCNWWFR